jgi:hypothetical protein
VGFEASGKDAFSDVIKDIPASRHDPEVHHEKENDDANYSDRACLMEASKAIELAPEPESMAAPLSRWSTKQGKESSIPRERASTEDVDDRWDTEGEATSLSASRPEVVFVASRGCSGSARLPPSAEGSRATKESFARLLPDSRGTGDDNAAIVAVLREELYRPLTEEVAADVWRVRFDVCARSEPPRPLSWEYAIKQLQDARTGFRIALTKVLSELPLDAFSLEFSPASSQHLRTQQFEFVARETFGPAVDGCTSCRPSTIRLDVLRELTGVKSAARIKTFMSSSDDAVLIAPVQATELCTPYANMKTFVRSADVPAEQSSLLWRHLGSAISEVVRQQGTAWASTGSDVSWLTLQVAWTPESCKVASYRSPQFGTSTSQCFRVHDSDLPHRSTTDQVFAWLGCCSRGREEALLAFNKEIEVTVKPVASR